MPTLMDSPRPAIGMVTSPSRAERAVVAQAVGLVADDQGSRPIQVGLGVLLAPGGHRPQTGQAPSPELAEHLAGVAADDHGEVEQRPGRGPHRLRVVDVDRAVAAHHTTGARRLGAAQHGAGIAGVADVDAHHDQVGVLLVQPARGARRSGARPPARACGLTVPATLASTPGSSS